MTHYAITNLHNGCLEWLGKATSESEALAALANEIGDPEMTREHLEINQVPAARVQVAEALMARGAPPDDRTLHDILEVDPNVLMGEWEDCEGEIDSFVAYCYGEDGEQAGIVSIRLERAVYLGVTLYRWAEESEAVIAAEPCLDKDEAIARGREYAQRQRGEC